MHQFQESAFALGSAKSAYLEMLLNGCGKTLIGVDLFGSASHLKLPHTPKAKPIRDCWQKVMMNELLRNVRDLSSWVPS